jgi:hypothetical protein
MITIPNSRDKPVGDVLSQIGDLRKQYDTKDLMVEDGKRYSDAWNDRGYRRTNLSWIDWWIAGEIPPKSIGGKAGKTRQILDDYRKGKN